jgi:chitinase
MALDVVQSAALLYFKVPGAALLSFEAPIQLLSVSLIDPFLCTHVVFAFASNNPAGEVFVIPTLAAKIRSLVNLRSQNPSLKVMVTMFDNFRAISTNVREVFAENLLNFVIEYGLDGVDIDWEWPAASDRINFELMLHEIRIRFRPQGKILTAAVGGCENLATSYDAEALLEELDFLNVMTCELKH